MPRVISAPIQTGVDAAISEPSYLVEILLDAPLHYSTMDAVTWNSINWLVNGVRLEGVSEDGGRLILRNDDNTGSALVLNNVTRDKEVRIYKYYNGDAKWLYQLYLSEADIGRDEVSIAMYASRNADSVAPRLRIIEPLFTNILKPGSFIRWGDERLRVES